ncbi:MAG: hypothetical protein WCK01_03215 [Candidatus Uhrbacteria bacterium]
MATSFIVLEGDWGGQIYLTVSSYGTDLTHLDQLLNELDAIAWSCNEGGGSSWTILDSDENDTEIGGGMGGGRAAQGSVWMHNEFRGLKKMEERVRFLLHLPASTRFIYGNG